MGSRFDAEFEEFVRGRSLALLRTATLLSGDVQVAQDLVQQTLWRTHRHWGNAAASPEAYARRVLVNLVHDERRRRRRRVVETELNDDGRLTPRRDDTERVVERDALVSALREVPGRQRATLVLRFWEDLSVEETATVLGCSAGNVKSNTHRGLKNIRLAMERGSAGDSQSGRNSQ